MGIRCQKVAHRDSLDKASWVRDGEAGIVNEHTDPAQNGVVTVAKRIDNRLSDGISIKRGNGVLEEPERDLRHRVPRFNGGHNLLDGVEQRLTIGDVYLDICALHDLKNGL